METMFNREPDGATSDATWPMCRPLMPHVADSAERAFASGQRIASRALKAEEMFSGVMYRQALDAYEKLHYAMCSSTADYDKSLALEEAEEILRNILRLYLEVHCAKEGVDQTQ